jgi:hypothetical protein
MNEDLLTEIRKIDRSIVGIRNCNGGVEFAIKALETYFPDGINWLPISQASLPVEKYVIKWMKLGGKID